MATRISDFFVVCVDWKNKSFNHIGSITCRNVRSVVYQLREDEAWPGPSELNRQEKKTSCSE